MRIVVDASVASKWLFQEDDTDIAEALAEQDHEFFAPGFLALEVGNAIWRKSRQGQITPEEALLLLDKIPELPLVWSDNNRADMEAIRLALELDHPVYDCLYLAIAYQMDALVVTADSRFVNALVGTTHEDAVRTLRQLVAT